MKRLTSAAKAEALRELTARVLFRIAKHRDEAPGSQEGDEDEQSYGFVDDDTGREFEIRATLGESDAGRVAERFFMSEMAPTGRVCLHQDGRLIRSYRETRIDELEEAVGPNGLRAALLKEGIDPQTLGYAGGGYCIGAVYHPTLQACAEAIARALLANERYRYFEPLTEQQKTRQARRDAVASNAYWQSQRKQHQAAMAEPGIFKGCRSMLGPLSREAKHRILAYLNDPNQATWLAVRGTVVTGRGTLWQAWCEDDASAPTSGDVGFPDRDQLTQAIRHAVERHADEVNERLAQTDPRGLRAV